MSTFIPGRTADRSRSRSGNFRFNKGSPSLCPMKVGGENEFTLWYGTMYLCRIAFQTSSDMNARDLSMSLLGQYPHVRSQKLVSSTWKFTGHLPEYQRFDYPQRTGAVRLRDPPLEVQ